MLKIKCDINQQDLKTVDLHFVKSKSFSLTWSCGSRQRDTTSSGWKFSLNNLAVKGLSLEGEVICHVYSPPPPSRKKPVIFYCRLHEGLVLFGIDNHVVTAESSVHASWVRGLYSSLPPHGMLLRALTTSFRNYVIIIKIFGVYWTKKKW